MSTHRQRLTSWLEAERRGHDAAAEDALGGLFKALPEAMPSPGFADRVLRGAGIVAAPRLAERLGSSWRRAVEALWNAPWGVPQRAAVAFCLCLAGLTLAALPGVAVALGRHLLGDASLADALGLTVQFFTHGLEQWAVAVEVAERLGRLYGALFLVATSPPVLGVWAAAVVFSALTLRWLTQILDRSPEHVVAS